jgi:hypothetical protein
VPTAQFRVLFSLVVLKHERRKVAHFNVTEHQTGPADVTAIGWNFSGSCECVAICCATGTESMLNISVNACKHWLGGFFSHVMHDAAFLKYYGALLIDTQDVSACRHQTKSKKEDLMTEHEKIQELIRLKDQAPIALDPDKSALLIIDVQRYFARPESPFAQVFEKLVPGATDGYFERVQSTVLPNIQRLWSVSAPIICRSSSAVLVPLWRMAGIFRNG